MKGLSRLVRVEKRIEKPTKGYDTHALKASLVFSIQRANLERRLIRACLTNH
jgi:hypothetical protein